MTARQIVAGAIRTADEQGLAALSMRRVAEDLGVGTMTLYTYVPGRPQLLTLMLDAVAGEAAEASAAHARKGWRTDLERVADVNWDLLHRHPWMLDIATPRPILGPGTTKKYDAELRPLDGIGLSDVEMDATLALVLAHVRSTAQAAVEMARAANETGQTDREWWDEQAPLLAALAAPQDTPLANRVGRSAGAAHDASHNPEHALRFGLARILDGIESLIRSR